jgi:hypothetical protein
LTLGTKSKEFKDLKEIIEHLEKVLILEEIREELKHENIR